MTLGLHALLQECGVTHTVDVVQRTDIYSTSLRTLLCCRLYHAQRVSVARKPLPQPQRCINHEAHNALGDA